MAESIVTDKEVGKSGASCVVTEEVLRAIFRDNSKSKLQTFLIHPLVVITFGGAVVAGIGAFLTHIYTLKQKDIDHNQSIQQSKLASQRSFSDELNKIRIQKIGEMWELIDTNEEIIDRMLRSVDRSPNSTNQRNANVKAIENLIQQDRMIVSKNRFWLGDQRSIETTSSLQKNVDLALNILLAHPEADLSQMFEERMRAKKDIIQIRNGMLSENEPCK